MQKIARRMFCGTALMAFPMLALPLEKNENGGPSDSMLDIIADEFTRITADGAQNGFTAEHFRRYAANMRFYDAHLEIRGMNKELNSRMDDDDFHKLKPGRAAQITAEYWRKHGIYFDSDDLASGLFLDWQTYRSLKMAIKKHGGVHKIHERIADALDRKAKEFDAAVFRGGPAFKEGRVSFPKSGVTSRSDYMAVQYDVSMFLGVNLDCLCRALIVEGSILSLMCITGLCVPCCGPAAFMLAFEKLMEGLSMCSSSAC